MSQVTEDFRSYFHAAATTAREIGQHASEEMVDRILLHLEQSEYPSLGQVCYVFGAGSHPKSSYTDMISRKGVSVVHFESVLPRGLRIIPSYQGLVKINDPGTLGYVFTKLMEQATVIALIFDAALESEFLVSVRNVAKHGDHSFGIKKDPGYVLYLGDGDREDSPTGMVHLLSYGKRGPWKDLFSEIRSDDEARLE